MGALVCIFMIFITAFVFQVAEAQQPSQDCSVPQTLGQYSSRLHVLSTDGTPQNGTDWRDTTLATQNNQPVTVGVSVACGIPPYTFQFYDNGNLMPQYSITIQNGDLATYSFTPQAPTKEYFSYIVHDSVGNWGSSYTTVDVIANSQSVSPSNLGSEPTTSYNNNVVGTSQGQNTTSPSSIIPVIAGVLVLVVIIVIIAIAAGKRKKKIPPPQISMPQNYESRSPTMPLDEDEKTEGKHEVHVNVSMDIKNGVVQLKCNSCGASMPPPKDKSNWIKCEHCGAGYFIPKNIFDKL